MENNELFNKCTNEDCMTHIQDDSDVSISEISSCDDLIEMPAVWDGSKDIDILNTDIKLDLKTEPKVKEEVVIDKVLEGSIYTEKEHNLINKTVEFFDSVITEKSKDMSNNSDVRVGIEAAKTMTDLLTGTAKIRETVKSDQTNSASTAAVAAALSEISSNLGKVAVNRDIELPGELEISDKDLVPDELSGVNSKVITLDSVLKDN